MKKTTLILLSFIAANVLPAQNTDSSAVYFQKGMTEKGAAHYLPASKHFDKAIQFDAKNLQAYWKTGM